MYLHLRRFVTCVWALLDGGVEAGEDAAAAAAAAANGELAVVSLGGRNTEALFVGTLSAFCGRRWRVGEGVHERPHEKDRKRKRVNDVSSAGWMGR